MSSAIKESETDEQLIQAFAREDKTVQHKLFALAYVANMSLTEVLRQARSYGLANNVKPMIQNGAEIRFRRVH